MPPMLAPERPARIGRPTAVGLHRGAQIALAGYVRRGVTARPVAVVAAARSRC